MPAQGKLIDADLRLVDGLPPLDVAIPPLPDLLETDPGEEVIHASLCRHSEYFPLVVDTHHRNWFRWVLTKYELPSGNVTDFAYVVTTSVENTIVLVEIEDPAKRLWVGPSEKPEKAKEFVRAIEQVEQWRADLEKPEQQIQLIGEMKTMMGHSGLAANPWRIEYVLIYGRSRDNVSAAQKEAFTRLQRHGGIHLRTFDNLVEAKTTGYSDQLHNVVRVTRPGPKFSYAYLNREPMAEFAYLKPGTMILDARVERLLKAKSYDIEAWKTGKLLIVNERQPRDALSQVLPSCQGAVRPSAT